MANQTVKVNVSQHGSGFLRAFGETFVKVAALHTQNGSQDRHGKAAVKGGLADTLLLVFSVGVVSQPIISPRPPQIPKQPFLHKPLRPVVDVTI